MRENKRLARLAQKSGPAPMLAIILIKSGAPAGTEEAFLGPSCARMLCAILRSDRARAKLVALLAGQESPRGRHYLGPGPCRSLWRPNEMLPGRRMSACHGNVVLRRLLGPWNG